MSLGSALKCLLCLVRCSKYLYYVKKAVCLVFIAVALVTGVSLLSGNRCLIRRLKEMI